MPETARFEMQVEFVIGQSRLVVGKLLARSAAKWMLTGHSTLSGYRIEALEFPPRAAKADGSPRLDLIAFRLRESDCKRFSVGQIVWLEGIELIE
jgi:hypothetical protein